MSGENVGKSIFMEVVEADRPEDSIKFLYATDKKLVSLVPPGKTGYVMCQCDYGDTCPNNPDKILCGAFPLCRIRIK